MKDVLMDAFRLGLGAMDMTREQAARLVGRIQRRYPGEIRDGRKMIDDLVAQSRKNATAFNRKVEKEVTAVIRRQKLVEERDLKELAANVKELAKTTAKMGAKVGKRTAQAARKGAKKVRKAVKNRTAARKPAKSAKKRAKKPARRTASKR